MRGPKGEGGKLIKCNWGDPKVNSARDCYKWKDALCIPVNDTRFNVKFLRELQKKKSKRYTGPCVVSFALEIVALTSVANDSAWGCNRQASRFDAFTISATA